MVSVMDVRRGGTGLAALLVAVVTVLSTMPATAQSMAFRQALAEAAASDADIAEFYRGNGYTPIWTGSGNRDRTRRQEFVKAADAAGDHGLPVGRYSPDLIRTNIRAVRSEADLARLEVELSRLFLLYARDVQTGIVAPGRIDRDMVRQVPLRSRAGLLRAFSQSTPRAFLRALPPGSDEYAALMKEKMRLERVVSRGWGQPVPMGNTLRPGDSGAAVVALRNRLIAMDYMDRSASQAFDANLQRAVQLFQQDHGLSPDGVAGPATLGEINASPQTRLSQVVVAMERERWMNHPDGRGSRHIWVNLTDFRTQLVDNGRVTFETRSVIGARNDDKQTPEFSDRMTYLEVNPDWTVPRSILGRDYLPLLQQNRNAARYMQLIDSRGRVVSRDGIDFTQYSERTFPYTLRQPPSEANALGLVKFMFPNPYAIYLHDTPTKSHFAREVRAYSSGCIRLNDPFELAYLLLGRQMSNPEAYFDGLIASGRQTRVDLATPVPVHLVYRTAFTEPRRRLQFRRDIYGRDAKVWAAMREAGVVLRAVQG